MQSVSLNLTQLKKDAFKKDPSFKQNYLLNENNFNQICSNHKLLCDIFKGLIHSNNIDAINFIIDSDKIVFDDGMIQSISNYRDKWLFDKIKLYMKDFSSLLIYSVVNNNEYIVKEICEKYKNNLHYFNIDIVYSKICENYKNGNGCDYITLNIIKLYNYKIPYFVFQSDFHIENIFRIWINAVFELDQENKLDKLRNMCTMLIKNNKPNYFKIILNDYNLVDTIYDSVELKLNIFRKNYKEKYINKNISTCCELLDCLKFDFTNYEISKKIFSILTYHLNIDNKEVCRYIDEILEKQKSTIIYNHDEFKIDYNENNYSYIYYEDDNDTNVNTQNCFYSLDIMKNIIKSKNIELFKLLMSKGYYNTNINEWFKYIIFYSNFNFFDYYFNIYSVHFDLENLNLVWEKKYYGKDIMEFTLYFAEKYDSNTFVVGFKQFEVLTKRYDMNEQEYSTLITLRPELENDEYYYLFLSTKQFHEMINLINKNKNFLDNYYYKILYSVLKHGCFIDQHIINFVRYILKKYHVPSNYTNVKSILIESAESKNKKIFGLIFNFFSPHIDITFDNHIIFRTLFDINNYYHHCRQDVEDNIILGLLNRFVGIEFYQVYFRTVISSDDKYRFVNGYSIGDANYGNITSEIKYNNVDINKKVGNLEQMEKCQLSAEEIINCVICNETESNIISNCKHQYCYNCVVKYEMKKNKITCPFCRQNCYPFKHILKEINE
jgi:hypothetical protein